MLRVLKFNHCTRIKDHEFFVVQFLLENHLLVLCLRPVEMFMKKFKSAIDLHRMAAIKKFYFCFISKVELVVEVFNLAILVGNPFIRLNQVVVATFHHKRSGENKICHLSITECTSHIEVWQFPFYTVHIATWIMSIHNLPCPVSEIA